MARARTQCAGAGAGRSGAPTGGGAGAAGRSTCIALGLLLVGFGATPAGAADVIKGSQVYSRHCASCHGPSGMSVMPGAPNLARGERMMQPDRALLASLKAGRNAKPAFIGILADQEILDVIAYSRTLRR